jgi:putative SOS response-associated peptidase YedK
MCGRFSLTVEEVAINERFGIEGSTDVPYVPRFNGAPGQHLYVITNSRPRILNRFKWGLIPPWAKEPGIGYKMINARAETIAEKVSFKTPLKSRRCLIPADGFYEWKQGPGKEKTPYRITLKDSSLFAMAGLWENWKDAEGKSVHTFTIITTAANELMQGLHERMPVILPAELEEVWLHEPDVQAVLPWLRPYPAELMHAWPITKLINSVVNDGPEVLQAV